MKFHSTKFDAARLIELETIDDDRGFFSRIFCQEELAKEGLSGEIRQANLSYNFKKGTLRGLHYQHPPDQEDKIMRCIRGEMLDMLVDLRPDSPTYLQWERYDLTAVNRMSIYIPKGFANGYMTLTDDVEVLYLVTQFYKPGNEGGIRWNDPSIGIEWPFEPVVISEKDANHPDIIPVKG